MLNFTPIAKQRVLKFMQAQSAQGVGALRIAGSRSEQRLWLVKQSDKQAADQVQDEGSFEVYLDASSAKQLTGATVARRRRHANRLQGFFPARCGRPRGPEGQEALDIHINPGVAGHGGSVTLVGVKDNAAIIRFGGGCQGCGAADVTLRQGIVRILKEQVPEIAAVRDETDHDAGENPYYAKEQDATDSPIAG